MGVKSADAKVDWLNKKRKWIKAVRDAAEDHYAAADSRCELEKAKLAQQKGIKPSDDFNVMNFETDNLKKQQKYSESRMDADKMQADVDRLERDWHAQQAAWEQSKSAR
jgi:outer membrane protein TolC